jgi:LacI family transcriptional regulator
MMIPANDDALLEDEFSSGFYSVTRRLAKKQQLDLFDLDISDLSAALAAIKKHKPDVVLTNKIELYAAMIESGLRVPEDVGVVHIDWHDAIPHLAGMRQNNRVVGSAGVDLVVGQLQKNESGALEFPQVVHVESAWIDGPSVK